MSRKFIVALSIPVFFTNFQLSYADLHPLLARQDAEHSLMEKLDLEFELNKQALVNSLMVKLEDAMYVPVPFSEHKINKTLRRERELFRGQSAEDVHSQQLRHLTSLLLSIYQEIVSGMILESSILAPTVSETFGTGHEHPSTGQVIERYFQMGQFAKSYGNMGTYLYDLADRLAENTAEAILLGREVPEEILSKSPEEIRAFLLDAIKVDVKAAIEKTLAGDRDPLIDLFDIYDPTKG